jgi:titin
VSSASNTIQGCYLGTDVTGMIARGNGGSGIWVKGPGNLIGGTNAADRNVISANQTGIYLAAAGSGNIIRGNFIGVSAAGTNALGNANYGIMLNDSGSNQVGGTDPAQRNVIAGNLQSGLYLNGSTAQGNVIQGNFIGVDVSGSRAVTNGADGITLNGAPGNTIGGGNVISGNGLAGININGSLAVSNIIQGNFIGTDALGKTAVGNFNAGVVIANASDNLIGGTTPGALNVISGNQQDGIFLTNATRMLIQGNHLGLSLAGTNAVPNALNGISLNNSRSNLIGGTVTAARNVISGNGFNGVGILRTNDFANVIAGNYIGTDAAGAKAVPNALAGVRIQASSNTVGGLTAGSGNLISGNGQHGVFLIGTNGAGMGNLVAANIIGLNAAGTGILPNTIAGVALNSAPSNQIGGIGTSARNIISGNGTLPNVGYVGLYLNGPRTTGNLVQGNYIGTDPSGTIARGNANEGIYLLNTASNQIGGSVAGAGNIIAANGTRGIWLVNATNILIQGNYVGTDRSGTTALANSYQGISITNGYFIQMGGVVSGAGNLISGNGYDGISMYNSPNNKIEGNIIGAAINRANALGNGNHGINLDMGSSNNFIGGTTIGAGNIFAYAPNGYCGVRVRTNAFNNLISGNSIFSNNALGIDLGNYGTNDIKHLQSGVSGTDANRLQNYPVLTNVVTGTATRIRGRFDGALNKTYTLEFFASPSGDASGNGEGQTFLGQTNVSVGGISPTNFSLTLPATVPAGWVVTATATDSTNNTSEFSNWTAVQTVPTVRIAGNAGAGTGTVSWTNAGGSYTLLQTTNLAAPAWISTGFNSPSSGLYSFPIGTTNPAVFYRLEAL